MDEPKAPWNRPKPTSSTPTKLTPEMRERAAERARKAGRKYPNLVDNMWAARVQKGGDDDES